jgi:hypothetical protein
MHIIFKKRIAKLSGIKLKEDIDENKLNDEIILLFSKKIPKEDDVHALASKLNLSVDDVENEIFKLLHSFLKKLGKHNQVPDDKFDPKELEIGRKVELEHTNNKWIAELIAKDHLMEFPDYYTRLTKMEKEAESEEK